MRWLVLASALVLAGCTETVTRTEYKTLYVPLAVTCVPQSFKDKPKPEFTDTKEALAAADGPTKFALLADNWGPRDQLIKELWIVVEGCSDVSR